MRPPRRMLGEMALLLAAASLLISSSSAGAQTDSNAQQPVKLNVLVLDSRNRPVSGLRQEDFQLTQEGKPQTISFFSAAEQPLSYGLVIDSSGSLRSQIDKVIMAGETIINGNKPEDEAFIMSFVSKTVTEQDFTRNKSRLLTALGSIDIKPGPTALLDAIYDAAEQLKRRKTENARRALILVTDGEDRNSFYNQDKLLSHLRKTDIQIFIIGLTLKLEKDNGGFSRKSSRDASEALLDRLARETGGRVFYPKDDRELQLAATEIMLSMRSQYVIGFIPATPLNSQQYRKVEVRVANSDDSPKRKVITRAGYVSP